jgi:hypothetical protein
MRWKIIFHTLDVGTIGRQDPLADVAGGERGTARPGHMPVLVDGAEASAGIELFTGRIRVIDLPFELDLFVATAPTAPTNIFPQTDA